MDRLPDGAEVGLENYYAACDLVAQESVAKSTRWLLWIALVQTAIGVAGTYLVWRSLSFNRTATNAAIKAAEAASRANEIAAQNAFIDQRPWLYADLRAAIGYYRGESNDVEAQFNYHFNLPVTLTNSGKTPAKDIECFAFCGVIEETERILDQAANLIMPPVDPLNVGAIPPSGEFTFDEGVGLRFRRPPQGQDREFNPYVALIFRYRSADMPEDAAPLVTAQDFRLRHRFSDQREDDALRLSDDSVGAVIARPRRSEMT